jgi:hypothetical protein
MQSPMWNTIKVKRCHDLLPAHRPGRYRSRFWFCGPMQIIQVTGCWIPPGAASQLNHQAAKLALPQTEVCEIGADYLHKARLSLLPTGARILQLKRPHFHRSGCPDKSRIPGRDVQVLRRRSNRALHRKGRQICSVRLGRSTSRLNGPRLTGRELVTQQNPLCSC